MRPHSSHSSSSWKISLSSLIIFLITGIFIFYLLALFHVFVLPFSLSGAGAGALGDLNQANEIHERDLIIKNLRGEIELRGEREREREGGGGGGGDERMELKYLNEIKNANELIEQLKEEIHSIQIKSENVIQNQPIKESLSQSDGVKRNGVVVLGMHRSGTSIVGGLMNKMGLKTGGPLIQPNFDNEKGFFERIDVVLQNDYIMKKQNVYYSYRTAFYDTLQGIKSILTEPESFFREGQRGLQFLNNPQSSPWMLKDPRLCITLRTWLPFLTAHPAILFTYRNPMDVALSMNTRETEHFPIPRGLKLWYIYNKRAIQQSSDLCRVITSHRKMMSQPTVELTRIHSELKEKCGLPVPHMVSTEDINDFIDVKLQHGRTSLLDSYCQDPGTDFDSLLPPEEKWKTNDPKHIQIFRASVKFYCDLENLNAFKTDYEWDEAVTDE